MSQASGLGPGRGTGAGTGAGPGRATAAGSGAGSGRRLVVEADGGSRGNPGPAGYGALVRDAETGQVLVEVAEAIGIATNNVAEYRGLVAGLQAAIRVDPTCSLEVRMDSRLVVEQMSGRWQVKNEDLRRLGDRARGVLPPERVHYTWVPRAQNRDADRLANAAMDAAAAGRAWSPSASPAPSPSPVASPAPAPFPVPASGSVSSSPVPAGSGAGAAAPADPPDDQERPASSRAPQRRPDVGPPTTLLLIRHGKTPLTEQQRMSGGGGADPELSAAGRQEAVRLAAALAELGGPGSPLPEVGPVEAVVSSPMRRSRETAAVIGDRLGLPVSVDDGWIEVSFGRWDGLTYAEIAESWPEELQAWQGSMSAAPPDGESLDDFARRIRSARERVTKTYPGQVVAVVSHVAPVRAVVHEALAAGPPAFWRLRVNTCSVSVTRHWQDGEAEVLAVNLRPAAGQGLRA